MPPHGSFLISVLTGVSEVAAFEAVYSWVIQSMFLGLSYMIIGEKIFEIFSPMNEREFIKFV